MTGSNNPPRFRWRRLVRANGDIESRLWVDDEETPFFTLTARYRSDFTWNHRHGLYGAGMCPKSGVARVLGGFDRVSEAKSRAERLWQEWKESGELDERVRIGRAAAKAWKRFWRGDYS